MEHNTDTDIKAHLLEMTDILSPTTNETLMQDYVSAYLCKLGAQVADDYMGNVVGSFRRGASRTVAVCAHADTIAVQITNILHSGYLQFRPIGPMPHTLLGQRVSVLTRRRGIVPGVIGFDPTSQYGQPKGLIFDDLWIDIGVDSKAQAREFVEVGDVAAFTPQLFSLSDDKIAGTALDNRAGLLVALETARIYTELGCDVNLDIIATAQEEVGLRGAQIAPKQSKAEACIVVDVEYATDTPTPHSNQLSEVVLGKGPVLLHKADNCRCLQNEIAEIAEREGIAVQHGVGRYPYGGTDASQIQVGWCGMPVANLSIPCRYMHSPVEVCSLSDISSTIKLITHWLKNC